MAIVINSIPVPEGTDIISAEALQTMVTALTGQINNIGETGVATFNNVVSGETVSQVVSYTNTYSKEPRVVAVNSASFPHAVFTSVSNLSTTGFTLYTRHAVGDTRNLYVVWIAMAL